VKLIQTLSKYLLHRCLWCKHSCTSYFYYWK